MLAMSCKIPTTTLDGIHRYVKEGVPTGGFLYAVLCNNLVEAFLRADEGNTAALGDIAAYMYHEVPSSCWGSAEKVKAWLDSRSDNRTVDRTTDNRQVD